MCLTTSHRSPRTMCCAAKRGTDSATPCTSRSTSCPKTMATEMRTSICAIARTRSRIYRNASTAMRGTMIAGLARATWTPCIIVNKVTLCKTFPTCFLCKMAKCRASPCSMMRVEVIRDLINALPSQWSTTLLTQWTEICTVHAESKVRFLTTKRAPRSMIDYAKISTVEKLNRECNSKIYLIIIEEMVVRNILMTCCTISWIIPRTIRESALALSQLAQSRRAWKTSPLTSDKVFHSLSASRWRRNT